MTTIIKSDSLQPVNTHFYIQKHQALSNFLAISYTIIAFVCGIILLFSPIAIINLFSVILLTHSLIYSAYLTHEFMHGTIFKSRSWNTIFGNIMLWINGGCYNGFQPLTLQHIAHHIDRCDVFTFEPIKQLQNLPLILRRIILALEWLYFPIIGFWARWHSILAPFYNRERSNERGRLIGIIFIRMAIFALIGIISLKALILYFLAYIGMITVLRFGDAFQHTYEVFSSGEKLPKRDRAHEEAHTYSTLLSRNYSWLNVLLLNFGYHNAHHAVMKCPWHSLPELNKELEQSSNIRYLSLRQQLINYHRFRITRFLLGQGIAIDKNQNPTFDEFYGAHDVSFLFLY
ncbi:putative fatty acid desaturase [Chondrocystis sp. NIES-4102]|nr:putative fatty acid desaturase [Chondrocystis sp. NIES-4102]